MTPADIIASARHLLNDTDPAGYRQDDPELLGYVNDAMREAVSLAPSLFSVVGDMACVSGRCEQLLTFNDAAQITDVLSLHEGGAITLMDRATFDAFRPGWRADAEAPAIHWAPIEGDPRRFYIYPKAPPGQLICVRYIKNPKELGMSDKIDEVPSQYWPALTDYVVYRAELKDDEHVLSQRAASLYASFRAKFGAQ